MVRDGTGCRATSAPPLRRETWGLRTRRHAWFWEQWKRIVADAFVEIYGQQRGSAMACFWPYLKTVFGLAALGAVGVTISAYFTKK